MVIAASLEAWLKRREEARIERRVAEATERVTEQVTTQVHRAWSEWNQRRLEAESNGESFDEQPPDFGQKLSG